MIKDIYQRREQAPHWWYNKSSDLHASAGALWIAMAEPEGSKYKDELGLGSGFSMAVACWPVYKMLYGMSFELIIKAIIVAKGLPVPHTHDLLKLVAKAQIQLEDKERSVLSALSGSIVWDGRYPVPKEPEDMKAHYRNMEEVLYDMEPFGSTYIKNRNDALDWDKLGLMRNKLADIFFSLTNTM